MIFYIIVFVSILLPGIAGEHQKKEALLFSFLLLFIPWGLQYEMNVDWDGNLFRWVTHRDMASNHEIEQGYIFLLETFKPIGFFGWLMVSALLELTVLFLYTRKYVDKTNYWMSIMLLMTIMNYGYFMINSNRQSICTMLGMLSLFLIMGCDERNRRFLDKGMVVPIVLLLVTPTIHSAGYLLFLYIPLYIFSRINLYIKPLFLFCLLNGLYFSRYIVDAQSLLDYIHIDLEFFTESTDYYSHYFDEIESLKRSYPITEVIYDLIIINIFCFLYNELESNIRFLGTFSVVGILMVGFLNWTMQRMALPFLWFNVFSLPMLLGKLSNQLDKKYIISVNFIKTYLILFCMYQFVRTMSHVQCYRWNDFQTIFSAPKWL